MMEFQEYQTRAHETSTTGDLDVYSLGLIGEAGSVASAIKKYKRDHPAEPQIKKDIAEELGDDFGICQRSRLGSAFS
jgi:NTP pyrophosphatase (non-canonical NTP hydrolase)